VLPARRAAVTAGVDGVVARVLKLEGDSVKAGEVVAVLENEAYAASAAAARAAYDIAEADVSRFRAAGDAAAAFEAESHRKELAARIALEDERLARTRLVSPVEGVVVTPRVQERVGQNLARGAELCVVADTRTMVAEVAIPEEEAARLQPGQPAEVKLNTYPGRTFAGSVTRVGAVVREEGKDRFVVAEIGIENVDGLLKTGMQGRGKVRVGWSSIATLVLRRPARWLYARLWPVLP
jgi:multidrug resistance efflux pump